MRKVNIVRYSNQKGLVVSDSSQLGWLVICACTSHLPRDQLLYSHLCAHDERILRSDGTASGRKEAPANATSAKGDVLGAAPAGEKRPANSNTLPRWQRDRARLKQSYPQYRLQEPIRATNDGAMSNMPA